MRSIFLTTLMISIFGCANSQTIDLKLRNELLEIFRTDQLYRGELSLMGPQSINFLSLWKKQNIIDSTNLVRVIGILDSIGYPGKSLLEAKQMKQLFMLYNIHS